MSEATKKKQSELHLGQTAWNKGKTCPQISKAKSGVRHTPEALAIFAECHKGSIQTEEMKKKTSCKMAEAHKLQNTDTKEIFDVVNLRQFCKENNLSQGSLTTYHRTKNFKLLATTKNIQTYKIKNLVTNEVFETTNLAHFCKPLGISNSGLLTKYRNRKPYMNYQILDIVVTPTIKVYP